MELYYVLLLPFLFVISLKLGVGWGNGQFSYIDTYFIGFSLLGYWLCALQLHVEH